MSTRTGLVKFKGNPVGIGGPGVKVGDAAPAFTVVGNDLKDVSLDQFKGKTVIINSVPSLDTGICDLQGKRFNQEAAALGDGVVVLVISRDLPFAQKRWCGAVDAKAVTTASDFRGHSFGKAWGLEMVDGPLAGLLARAVYVVGKDGKIKYEQIVPEIAQEPDYAPVLAAAKAG